MTTQLKNKVSEQAYQDREDSPSMLKVFERNIDAAIKRQGYNLKLSGAAIVSEGVKDYFSASCEYVVGVPGPMPVIDITRVAEARPIAQKLIVEGFRFKTLKALEFESMAIGIGSRWQLEYYDGGSSNEDNDEVDDGRVNSLKDDDKAKTEQ